MGGTLTFNPVAGASSPCDGQVYGNGGVGETWANLRSIATGTVGNISATEHTSGAYASTTADKWWSLDRLIFNFNTASLSGKTIISATIRLRIRTKLLIVGNSPTWAFVSVSPASTDNIVTADYSAFGTDAASDTKAYADIAVPGYTTWTLNAIGLALINKSGVTSIGFREMVYDVGGTTPTWASAGANRLWVQQADNETETYRPLLTVNYTEMVVRTDAATNLSSSTATLNGTLTEDSDDTPVTCHFQYGLTTAYELGDTTNQTPIAQGASFSQLVSGLSPGITYHYRAVAHGNSGATVYGADAIFNSANYPSYPQTRVSGLIHRWSPGNYTLEVSLGGLSSGTGIPVPGKTYSPAIPPTPKPPTKSVYTSTDYEAWLRTRDLYTILAIFGHFPTFDEWLAWMLVWGGASY